jgi:hypothetical protein
MKRILITLIMVAVVAPLLADVIYLNNSTKIEGEIMGIAADSVTIQTKGPDSKIVKLANNEIMRIEKEKGEVTIAKSVKAVGYGCLGAIIGGGVGTTIVVLGHGLDSGELSVVLITGLVITGILIGVGVGSR